MTINYICPVCQAVWKVGESTHTDRQGVGQLTQCCPPCHQERRRQLAELEARYPSAESLGLVGSITEIPTERYGRPHARGKRNVKKPGIMGG
jgi:hypothetical protein